MKNIKIATLALLSLAVFAMPILAQNADTTQLFKQMKPIDAEQLKKDSDKFKQKMETYKNSLESMQKNTKGLTKEQIIQAREMAAASAYEAILETKKIDFGQRVSLDKLVPPSSEEIKNAIYALHLSADNYTLVDLKTGKEIPEGKMTFMYNDFQGKYEYKIEFILLKSILIIQVFPQLSKEKEELLPYNYIAFNKTENSITFEAMAEMIGTSSGHHGFSKVLLKKVK